MRLLEIVNTYKHTHKRKSDNVNLIKINTLYSLLLRGVCVRARVCRPTKRASFNKGSACSFDSCTSIPS